MKKIGTALVVGAITSALLLGTTGCANVDGSPLDNAALTIRASSVSEAVDISDLLFGIFLEDINFASYAMDDNLIANGNFEELASSPSVNHLQNYWTATSGANIAVEATEGVFASHADYHNSEYSTNVNPHYAKVTVSSANAGLSNAGYTHPGIAVEKKVSYNFSAFIKAPGGATKATARIVDDSKTYATVTFDVKQNASWVKYQRTVKASATGTENLRFELVFDTPGTYYVDAVAFETQDSTIGIKNYVYNAIKDLSPKFMRFPGGCIIEGDNANVDEKGRCLEVYDWKNSIGAVQNGTEAGDDTVPAFTYLLDTDGNATQTTTYGEWVTRTNNFDLWGYNMDYGLGFYEYFLLCESIGASPVPIVNCGFSDQGGAADASKRGTSMVGRHEKYVEDYVQDALNLIEFANGDTSTKWGKIRSDMGHPAPFNVKYIGVGNEQFERKYYDCYEQFLEAFHAAQKENPAIYGEVEPIVGSGLVFSDCDYGPAAANRALLAPAAGKLYRSSGKITSLSEYGVVDHHYYMGYSDFLHYATPEDCIYDKYPRTGADAYKVFVGEYSANGATRYYGYSAEHQTNSWFTAISEAAYMTALERNGDIVDLAAYAPMFGVCGETYRDDGVNQWPVDMMYFTNNELLLSPNYYVQQLFMKYSGTHYIKSELTDVSASFNATTIVDGYDQTALYQSITYDEKTGDIIVKLVNAGNRKINLNVDLGNVEVTSRADCTLLKGVNGADSVNMLGKNGYQVTPENFTLGLKSSVFGYGLAAYSVVAIRVHTK